MVAGIAATRNISPATTHHRKQPRFFMSKVVFQQKAEAIARSLPEPTCTVLRLCYWEKKTYREVAEHLGISPDTVKKHISKALQMLREEMKD